jgi:hypothetical protein
LFDQTIQGGGVFRRDDVKAVLGIAGQVFRVRGQFTHQND